MDTKDKKKDEIIKKAVKEIIPHIDLSILILAKAYADCDDSDKITEYHIKRSALTFRTITRISLWERLKEKVEKIFEKEQRERVEQNEKV